MLTHLKQATADLHARAEARLYGERILRSELTVGEYGHLLRTHYAFQLALEAAIEREPGPWEAIDPVARRKAHLAAADLAALGGPLPPTVDYLGGWTFARLLGAAYVGEGSTLGGSVIARCLSKNGALAARIEPLRFFGAYGAETGVRWKTFCAFLTGQPDHYAAEAIAGACQAFQLFLDISQHTDHATTMPSAHHAASAALSISTTASAAGRKKIIVFDDNDDLLELVSRVLGKHYDVEICATLDCVLDKVRSFAPDLILMDNTIGATDCRDAVASLRTDPATRHIPVILISGNADIEALARDLRVDGHLAKPFSIKYLREYVQERVGGVQG